MPLIVLCGLPNSGKTVRALEIVDFLKRKHPHLEVKIISEDTLNLNRAASYQNSLQEKNTRGTLKSEVDRWVTKENLVVLDSLNYIKGFRYELYCITKAQSSPHCVVFVDTPIETCKEWKASQSPEKDSFTDEQMDELAFRFEKPIGKNRWDAPLFHLRPLEVLQPRRGKEVYVNLEDLIEDTGAKEEPTQEFNYEYFKDTTVLEEIDQALFHGVAPKPNQATLPQKIENTNFVQELDRITQAIITAILEAQNTAMLGDLIVVPETTEKIVLCKKLGMAELRRQRRRFLKLAQTNPPLASKIGETFAIFLNSTFATE